MVNGHGARLYREQGARAADPQALCQRVHAAVKNAQVALKRPGGQMHQGQCGHRSTANMPQFQQEGCPRFFVAAGSNPGLYWARSYLNALALIRPTGVRAALLKINDPPSARSSVCPAIADASPARSNPCKGAATTQNAGPFSDRSSTTRMRCKTTRQRSRQDDFASGSSRLQLFGQPYPWLHGDPGPHRQGCGPDRKAGW